MSIDKATGLDRQHIAIGGQDYELSPMTFRMVGQARKYIADSKIRQIVNQSKDMDLPKDVLTQLLRDAYAAKQSDDLDIDGVLYLLHLRLAHAGITHEQVLDFDVADVMAAAATIMDDGTASDDSTPSKKKTDTSPTTYSFIETLDSFESNIAPLVRHCNVPIGEVLDLTIYQAKLLIDSAIAEAEQAKSRARGKGRPSNEPDRRVKIGKDSDPAAVRAAIERLKCIV